MSTAVPIILIIVVWLFVLAPWILNSQRPMGRTGEAFEETRVLFEGDSGKAPRRRRPRLSLKDLRRRGTSETEDEYELVSPADVELGRGEDSPRADSAGTTAVPETVEGEVIEEDDILLIDDELPSEQSEEGADSGSGSGVDEASEAEDVAEAELISDAPSATSSSAASAESDEPDAPGKVAPKLAEDAYDMDETFTSPADLMYPGAVDSPEASAVESSRDNESHEDEAGEDADVEGEDLAAEDTGLSAEELEFAQRRLGRGGWDPVAAEKASADRFQRRQRTLIGLAVAAVAAVALGIIVGGPAWWPAAVVAVVGGIYLVALRNQVRHEQDLLRRRVRHLRRARLGVRNAEDEALAIPRNLRRPGAVVLESDDDSPDFDYLPVRYSDDEFGGHDTARRRAPRRDYLAVRRVG